MVPILVSFAVAVSILLFSTQLFLKKTERLSRFLRLSPLIIGITIVSIGTSLPELTVSSVAALSKDTGLAIGNIIGSNIVNVLFVFAVGILMGNLRVGTTKTQRTIAIMAGISFLFLALYFLKASNTLSAIILLVITGYVTVDEYLWGIRGRKHEDAKSLRKKHIIPFTAKEGVFLSASLAGVVIGGIQTVSAVERLSALLGFSTTILGFSVTAIATSLPELLTTIFSQEDHEEKITIGNLIGSNMYNIALIGGIILLVAPWSIISLFQITAFTVATLAFLTIVTVYKGRIIPRSVGAVLLVGCILYLMFLR